MHELRIGLLAIGVLLIEGCRSVPRTAPTLSPPIVTLEMQNLTRAEKRILVRFMEEAVGSRWRVEAVAGGEAGARNGALVYRVHLHRWGDHDQLHRMLISVRGFPDNHQILQNHTSRAALAYTSSQASSESMALVTIGVAPAGATLHFDTRVPRPAVATERSGRYQLRLPFSFIKSHDYIYFHSVYKGQYRYYRYHLDSERQEQIPGVNSPEDMARYMASRRGRRSRPDPQR